LLRVRLASNAVAFSNLAPASRNPREIFQRYSSGEGFKKIADALNRKGTPTPRPKGVRDERTGQVVNRKASWATSNVRSLLKNPLYRGIARWNYLKQRDGDGITILEVNPESEQKTLHHRDWQIINDDLADAVEARFADETRKKFRSKPGARAKYLLSGGLLLCPSCGGRFEVQNGEYYVCGTRRKCGKAVCKNPISLRVEVVDDFVLGLLEGEVLCPAFVETCLSLVCGNRVDDGRARLEEERDSLTAKIARLVGLVEAETGEVFDLAAKIKKADAERAALNRRIASMATPPDRKALKEALPQRSKDWRKVLRSKHVEEARFVVKSLIGPITLYHGEREVPKYARRSGPPRGVEGIEFGLRVRGRDSTVGIDERIIWCAECGCGGSQPAVLAAVERGGVIGPTSTHSVLALTGRQRGFAAVQDVQN
jgi:hypothetical protein